MMLEMRREQHQLDAVWIDVDSTTGQSAVRELQSMSSEGEPLQVAVVNLYGSNQESAVELRASGYNVAEIIIDEYVTSDGSASISFAGR
jgi:N-dimethylarginine dimethylaminohydrolase